MKLKKSVYGLMVKAESLSYIFDIVTPRFDSAYRPDWVYDASCKAKEFGMNRVYSKFNIKVIYYKMAVVMEVLIRPSDPLGAAFYQPSISYLVKNGGQVKAKEEGTDRDTGSIVCVHGNHYQQPQPRNIYKHIVCKTPVFCILLWISSYLMDE